MKTLNKALIATALTALIAGPAAAMVSPDLETDVLSAAGAGSNVNVIVDGDTVTLTGYVEDAYSLTAIEQAADVEGVETVINNVFRTN